MFLANVFSRYSTYITHTFYLDIFIDHIRDIKQNDNIFSANIVLKSLSLLEKAKVEFKKVLYILALIQPQIFLELKFMFYSKYKKRKMHIF